MIFSYNIRPETRALHLQVQLRTQRNQQKDTKKERTKYLARNEFLHQITNNTNPIGEGGAVDVPEVIMTGHGLDIEFTQKTIGDAFYALTIEWACFKLQDGSSTKEGANKRLVAVGDNVLVALWQFYKAETGRKATTETTVAKNSEKSNEVR